jgi:ABC-2 type transport system ATP-binding protein
MMTPVIQTDRLTRRFGEKIAVDQVTLSVERGEVFGLLGPNGAGKTTLVRLLNGMLRISTGSARVLDYDPVSQGNQLRQHTGVLTETPSLYENLTARDNLLFFGTLYGVPEADLRGRVDEILDLFGLLERGADKAGTFSKGMKQRLALARTLVHQPELLFFDEPTAALDPEASRQVTELIAHLSREGGRTIFLCTHNLDEAQRLCDRVAVINKGQLLRVGAPAQLARDLFQGLWIDVKMRNAADSTMAATLRALAGVNDLTTADQQLAIQVSNEDVIPAVVAKIVELGGQIMQVNPREHSLEEIYFRVQEEAKS